MASPQGEAGRRPRDEEGSHRAVALVLVSHSREIASGTCALAGQMAPETTIIPAGGMEGGDLGTSYDLVSDAVGRALAAADGVVILADLGSAVLTVESVLEMEEGFAERTLLADGPFVEGAVAAAVAANGGLGLEEVRDVAQRAALSFLLSAGSQDAGGDVMTEGGTAATSTGPAVLSAAATVGNRLGLHARPAAELARLIAGLDADVTINDVQGSSVLELMQLGVTGGDQVTVRASGPEAENALRSVVETIEGGFGEE